MRVCCSDWIQTRTTQDMNIKLQESMSDRKFNLLMAGCIAAAGIVPFAWYYLARFVGKNVK
jgi:hypothetical protein